MAADTVTIYQDPTLNVSFTTTVATVSGTKGHMYLKGPGNHASVGVQGEYIRQSAFTYRWLRDANIGAQDATPTAYSYMPMADDPIYQ